MKDRKGKITTAIWCRAAQIETDHSFIVWNKDSFNQYPDSIKSKFAHYVFGLGEEDEPQRLPSPQLAINVLNTRNTFESLEESLDEAFEIKVAHAVCDYQSFVEETDNSCDNPLILLRLLVWQLLL